MLLWRVNPATEWYLLATGYTLTDCFISTLRFFNSFFPGTASLIASSKSSDQKRSHETKVNETIRYDFQDETRRYQTRPDQTRREAVDVVASIESSTAAAPPHDKERQPGTVLLSTQYGPA